MFQGYVEIVVFKNERKVVYNVGFVGSDKFVSVNIDVVQYFVFERKFI